MILLFLRAFSCVCLIIPCSNLAKMFSSSFGYEAPVQKKYSVQMPATLTLENIDGSIHIKTDWGQNSMVVSAVKRASTEQALKEIEIVEDVKPHAVALRSKYDPKETRAAVDYTIIIPEAMTLHLATGNGHVTIDNIQGDMTVATKQGDIEIVGSKGSLQLTSKKQGSITVHQPSGPIKATTTKGAINVYDARNSVVAHAQNGTIELYCKKVPAQGNVKLETKNGSILVHLPKTTNAELRAKTAKGNVTCQHRITLKPITMQLDNSAWEKLKKEVHGTLGTAAEAQISLVTHHGSIKLLEYA